MKLRSVATALGFSAAYVSDIERGNRRPPSLPVVASWARLIRVPESEMIGLASEGRGDAEVLRLRGALIAVNYELNHMKPNARVFAAKDIIGRALAGKEEQPT